MNLNDFIDEPDPFLDNPLEIGVSHFKHKALAQFYVNLSRGCAHGCAFCYAQWIALQQQRTLQERGIHDLKMQWGEYMFPRVFDENRFRSSLFRAMRTPASELSWDAPRAVMFCTTCDPFQTSRDENAATRSAQNAQLEFLFVQAMEMIRDESSLLVRILTRSPLARNHFELMSTFGDRLLFGMSIPTLNDRIARKYEPHAPGVKKRLETLRLAKESGLNIYLAAAPTFPEQDSEDYERLLTAVAPLEPVTVFHEPINRRGSNVKLMARSMSERGLEFQAEVFEGDGTWATYAMSSLRNFEAVAGDLGLGGKLKLWPDKDLLRDACLQSIVDHGIFSNSFDVAKWIRQWWGRPVSWPGKVSQNAG